MNPRDQPSGSGWLSREIAALVAAWERGERITAQEVIARHADLDTEAAIRLIYEETCLRREAGLEVDTSEVVSHYPRWKDELRDLFDCDRLIRSPASVEFPEVGETLGPFLLLAELGRGASGRTYMASDPTLADRPVVVKVIPDDQDEHLALARLRHTHIVPLFSEHTFPEQGLRGLCMPFLGGASLGQILEDLAEVPLSQRSGKLLVSLIDRNTPVTPATPPADGPFRRNLEQSSYVEAMTWIVACLADALHYAHARGLVHMDIKPSNVLITVDGQPMLLDFHLARSPIVRGEWVADRLGGTPGWMSPEQELAMTAVVEGHPAPLAVDGRSDNFALGLLLCEALGVSAISLKKGEIRASLLRVGGVSVGLADILKKCLRPDASDRYDDATTLAEDLRRELNDLPLHGVRNRSFRERWGKWRRRHPGALAWGITAIVVLLAVIAAGTASLIIYRQRVDQIEAALAEGRDNRARGRYAEATRALERGLESARSFSAFGDLKRSIESELRLAERGWLADELHELADRIRFRYGIDLPSADDAQSLVKICRTIWDRRDRLLTAESRAHPSVLDARIKSDLLELAAIWADLQVKLASSATAIEARQDAVKLLNEAEASFGPSFALDLRREQLLPSPDERAEVEKARVPGTAWEHYELGRYDLRRGRIKAAATEFDRTVELRPQDFWSNFYQGLCCFRLKRFEAAIAAFQASIALAPEAAICHYNRALAYTALDRIEEAHRGYTRAIELDPNLAAARLNRGILAYKSGQHSEAVADFEAGLRTQADREARGRLHFNLALAQRAQRDRRAAFANAQKAVDLGCPDAIPLRDELR